MHAAPFLAVSRRGEKVALIVDTTGVRPGERANILRDYLSEASSAHDVRFLDPADRVTARLEHWQLSPDAALMQQTSSGISHTRTTRHLRRDAPERVAFVVHQGGIGTYEHAGVRHALTPGGLYVTDMNAPFHYLRPGSGTVRILQLERAKLDLTAELVQVASQRLASSPLCRLFRNYILGLTRNPEPLAATACASVLVPTTITLAECLLRDASAPGHTKTRELLHDQLIDRILLYLRTNYPRPELSAEMVAREHAISTRYLFKLWSTRPQSFAETVMSIRLAAAYRMLHSQPALPVAAVANRCGFPDPSHFGRRFRLAYGVSPARSRTEQPADPLIGMSTR